MQCLSGERLRKDHVSSSKEVAQSPSMQPLTSNNDIIKAGSTLKLNGNWKFVCFIETEISVTHDLHLAQPPIAKKNK